MPKVVVWIGAVSLCIFLTSCSNYFEPEVTPDTGKPAPRMKITRGSGYGEEVPFESKYSGT